MINDNLHITLIGCGKMGAAMLSGWLESDMAAHINILDPMADLPEFALDNVTHYKDAAAFQNDNPQIDVCIMAVKPQIMATVCESIKDTVPDTALILSIAAGQTIRNFENYFSSAQPIIRTMPNTPAAIGQGITAAVANAHVSDVQKQTADMLLQAVSDVVWLDDEKLLNAVTAVSGSGPAYIFHLIEVMAAAGEAQGLPANIAMQLARQTVIGSAALAAAEENTPASTLRENVTSPGGTTAAALSVLRDSGEMQDLFTRAITSATQRGKELET